MGENRPPELEEEEFGGEREKGGEDVVFREAPPLTEEEELAEIQREIEAAERSNFVPARQDVYVPPVSVTGKRKEGPPLRGETGGRGARPAGRRVVVPRRIPPGTGG